MFDFEKISQTLHELNVISLIVRSLLAILIGGAVGLERSKRNRPAGLRTHILVCFGSALVMMTNQFVSQNFDGSDPVRMGAQVISGIGFLGAGTIIWNGQDRVKGITTAAGLWAAACSGLAIGIGFYSGAIVSGVVMYVVMALMHRFDTTIHETAPLVPVYLEFDKNQMFSNFLLYARNNQLVVSDIKIAKNKFLKNKFFCATLSIKSAAHRTRAEVLAIVRSAPGIQFVEAL